MRGALREMLFHELADVAQHIFDINFSELVPFAMSGFIAYVSQYRSAFLRHLLYTSCFARAVFMVSNLGLADSSISCFVHSFRKPSSRTLPITTAAGW